MTVFYTDALANMIKAHIVKAMQSYSYAKFAKIVEYDPENCFVKVAYYNPVTDKFDQMSNWLSYLSLVNGKGSDSEGDGGKLWGNVHGPNMHEQVLVIPHDGDHNNGIVLGSIFTDKRPPPQVDDKFTKSGEWTYKNKSGSYIKFFENGDVSLYVTGNLNIHVDKNLNEHVVGDTTMGAEGTSIITGTSIMLNANAQVMSNAPATNTTQNLSAGNGATGTFTTPTGKTVTVVDGIIINIY